MRPVPNQCETIITFANPFSIGGIALNKERCKKRTLWTVIEKKTKQNLGCCGGCLKEFKRINDGDLKLYKIERKK